MAFLNSVVLDYPVEEVFRIFIRTAKRDFPKFNENNPVGCKVSKKVGAYSAQSATLEVEITGFKKNELYQITSTSSSAIYISTYDFEVVDDNSTRITLTEEDKKPGFFPGFNTLIQNIAFKGRVKRRFAYFVDSLEKEIETYRSKVEKNSKTKSDEESKVKAKAEAKAAKEAAKRAEEEAKAAKLAAAKAISEARVAAEQAEKAAKEAEAKAKSFEDELEDEAVSEAVAEITTDAIVNEEKENN
ncbi:DUF3284 domain-containing protein [Clostridium paraputrificum]|uniref:DUF3284 domain-containing protein n=1 Tax=Clostridium TaxID=1485 RepID=UPI003D32542E